VRKVWLTGIFVGAQQREGYAFFLDRHPQALHPAFAADIPFVAAVVELEEGVRMATRLIECDRDSLKLDLPLELKFEPIGDDFRLPVFRPRKE
jgi:hypothetical protein